MPINAVLVKKIIKSEHPTWQKYHEIWQRNEEYLLGDPSVYDDLKKYIWELAGDTVSHDERKKEAIYMNFMGMVAEKMTGTLREQPGVFDYGTLGELADPDSVASMLHRNFDGVGEDARGAHAFWMDTLALAWATSFRWVFTESTVQGAKTKADERAGMRPYAVDYSPVSSPNWHFANGELQWVYFKLKRRDLRVEGSEFKDESKDAYYILVKAGYEGLGDDFAGGGWWMVDEKGNEIESPTGPMQGDWTKTNGHIPIARLFYVRKKGSEITPPTSEDARRLSLQHMNLLSDLLNDAHTSGSRQIFMTVSYEQWDSMVNPKTGEGVAEHEESSEGGASTSPIYGKIVPVPAEPGVRNTFFDTGSVTASGAVTAALTACLERFTRFMLREISSAPGESGEARRVMSLDGLSPKLVHLASNLEEARTATVRNLEMRWGNPKPTGGVTWNKRFDLRGAVAKLREIVDLMNAAGFTSKSVLLRMFLRGLEEIGFDLDKEDGEGNITEKSIQAEIEASLASEAQRSALDSEFTGF